jgi:hypothetical protein
MKGRVLVHGENTLQGGHFEQEENKNLRDILYSFGGNFSLISFNISINI